MKIALVAMIVLVMNSGIECRQLSFVSEPLRVTDTYQGDRQGRHDDSIRNRPPLGRRLAMAIVLFLGGLWRGFRYSDERGASFGPDQYVGLFLCGLGLFVWIGTVAFPFTWGWWL